MNRWPPPPRLHRLISGGQTGVDRGALDAAIALNLDHGGWCPRGRRAEDGVIPVEYRLVETDSPAYPVRTELNVKESDGTLILFRRRLSGGTALTCQLARKHHKPCLMIDLDREPDIATARNWLVTHQISVLNVAGPRESSSPQIGEAAKSLLMRLLREEVRG